MSCDTRRGRRAEVAGNGFNSNLILVGGDAYGKPYSLGVPIPATPATTPANRYLFLVAPVIRLGANEKIRIVGLRQYLEIGTIVPDVAHAGCEYPVNIEVTSRTWSFTDGNVSWHLQRVPPMSLQTQHPANADGFQHLYAQTPALLFQNTPADVGGYVPPNGGEPWGSPIIPDLANFTDMRFGGQCCDAWHALDMEEEGPCDIAFFASVRQTVPAERCVLVLPVGFPVGVLKPEDEFVARVPGIGAGVTGAVYTRIGGSIIYERENKYEEPRHLVEPIPEMGPCHVPDKRME